MRRVLLLQEMARDLIQGRLEYLDGESSDHILDTSDAHGDTNPLPLTEGSYGNLSEGPGQKDRALVIDGRTLAYALNQNLEADFLRLAQHCSSVLCVRATPFQKVTFHFLLIPFLVIRLLTKQPLKTVLNLVQNVLMSILFTLFCLGCRREASKRQATQADLSYW